MGRVTFVLGGARSGKSTFAQQLAQELGGEKVVFVATAQALDEEMRQRVRLHREERPAGWCTIEAPVRVATAIREGAGDARVILLDCLSLLVSNVMLSGGEEPDPLQAEKDVIAEIEALLAAGREARSDLIVVSNEVGMGLVPPYPLGRLYRDLLGRANQMVAAQAEEVFWMVAGLAVDLRSLPNTRSIRQYRRPQN